MEQPQEASQEIIPPNQTLYVNHLNEKVKLKELKSQLRELFGKYGTILDVVASKRNGKKGQAFIVFDSVDEAQKAMSELQGKEYSGKPLNIAPAKSKSDVVAKRDGTFVERKRKLNPVAVSRAAKRRAAPPRPAVVVENNILFVDNLPHFVTQTVLQTIFGSYSGFVEVRTVAERPGFAFVEYENSILAGAAMQATDGLELDGMKMRVSYANK